MRIIIIEKKEKMKGKSGGRATEKEERLREKLKRGVLVGKRVGPFSCTPVRNWKPLPTAHVSIIDSADTNSLQEEQEEPPLLLFNNSNTVVVSARKLAAALWEFNHYLPSLSKMHRGVHISNGGGDSRLRRHEKRHHFLKDKGLDLSQFLADPTPISPDQVFT